MIGTCGVAEIRGKFEMVHDVRPEASMCCAGNGMEDMIRRFNDAEVICKECGTAADQGGSKSRFAISAIAADDDSAAFADNAACLQGKQGSLMKKDACDCTEKDAFDFAGLSCPLTGKCGLDNDVASVREVETSDGGNSDEYTTVLPNLNEGAGPYRVA
jgi:hypothetical protein